jgi:hypothetical protein
MNNEEKLESQESLLRVSDKLVTSVTELMRTAKSEEDLRIGFEKILEPMLFSIGIESKPRYERLGAEAQTIYRGRPDAVHGQVIIEYEEPGTFSSKRFVAHAHEQLVGYMEAIAQAHKLDPFNLLNRIIGVGFDGESIFFVQYQGKKNGKVAKIGREYFTRFGPYPLDSESARTLLTHLRSLSRLPLSAEHLAERFGPKSKIAPQVVSAFADALEHWGNPRIEVFFKEWKRLFGIVYGEQFSAHQAGEAKALAQLYNVGKETDFQELLFSVHTYFALLMKLIAAELLTLRETAFSSSLSSQLTHTSQEELQAQLSDIEEGSIYARRGITNFLEGDFFRWYLDAWSPRLEEAIREIARGLSDFEPATTTIDPEATRDLLKKLYQYLVPQDVRHKLGEYYTPDWLADLLLNEVGYDGNTLKRFLDPACGSGTFLVLAIQRAKEYGQKHKEPPLETAKRIVANIWGFDLNPLAVIASRTNYLFALGELANQLQNLEIPIYLADSVLWPEKSGQMKLNFVGGEHVKIQTSVKEFHVPYIWVKNEGLLMRTAAPLVEEMTNQNYSAQDAMKRFKKNGLVFPPHEQVVKNFYDEIVELEKQGKNGIWARFLKNAFAPMIAGKFDYVVGNPPWIRWGYLSNEYREATLPLWQNYGLFSLKGHAARLGGGEKDFSMLFTYASADYYLKKGAKLGFLITQEVFKSKGAGEGFRRFQLGEEGKQLKVLKAHDLVSVQPFEGAANKTAAVILKKDSTTIYPVPYILWKRKKGIGKIKTDIVLDEALRFLQKKKLMAQPIGTPTGSWQTISEKQKGLRAIEGKNEYQARRGVETDPYGIFLLEVIQVFHDGSLLIKNRTDLGKQKIQEIKERIESDLVFPLIRGSDLERWTLKSSIYALITQDPKTRNGFAEETMKNKWPRTYGYLSRFKEELLTRATYKKFHEATSDPFYSQYNIAEYTFTRFRTVWKSMASDVEACVVSQEKTPFGYKSIVPFKTTSFFPTDNEDEAHYLCAIINSLSVREFIKSFSSSGRGFGAPSVMNHVGIPKFDAKKELHQKLAKISKSLHELKARGHDEQISELEKENDKMVKELFAIKDV